MNVAIQKQTSATPSPALLELGYGFFAACLTLFLLHHGWSAFDDGSYAWIARRLLDGATLHANIISSHPGYANYLHSGLFYVFGEHLSVLRFPLPLLAWILVSSIARLARSCGTLAQGISAFSAATLGIVQWNTPSAGWFSVALAAATIVVFCNAYTTTSKRRFWLFVAGILLGLCAGFRQHNGVLLAAGLVMLHILLANRSHSEHPVGKWQQAISLLSLLTAIILIGFPAINSPSASIVLLLLPAILCAAYAIRKWLNETEARNIEWMPPVLAGCAAGFLPIVIVAAAHGALQAFVTNTIVSGSGYIGYSELKGVTFTVVLGDAFELFSTGKAYPWVSAVYMLGIVLLPLLMALLMYLRKDEIREPFVMGLVVLAAICLPINITFQNLLYAYYWLPAVSAAVIALIAIKRTRTTRLAIMLMAVLPAFALTFHAGRIPGSNWGDLMREPLTAQPACTLPNCNLRVSPQLLDEVSANYRDIISNVPDNRPLLILPEGVSLYPLLPHTSPWHIGFVMDGFTPDHEIDRLNLKVENTPGTVILVSHSYLHELGRPTRLNKLIHSWCLIGETPRYNRYEVCPVHTD